MKQAINRAGIVAFAKPDGIGVRISKDTAFEPDALVYLPPRVQPDAVEIPNPVIIVEVGSPGTRGYDAGFKLRGYSSVPSILHAVLVIATDKFLVHHKRSGEASFETTRAVDGILNLDPPGLAIPVADFFIEN